MRPITTEATTTVYVGPASKGIDPLPIEEIPELAPDGSLHKVLRSRWRLSDEERAAIILGADLVLDVIGTSLPPVRPTITAPPEADPERVFAVIDSAIARTTAISIAGLLGQIGYVTFAGEVLGWGEPAIAEVAEWLRKVGVEGVGTGDYVPGVVETLPRREET